ncbi:MAG: hypothetical protein ACJ8AG_04380, partial [Ktedonobacteraceae bacterium]
LNHKVCSCPLRDYCLPLQHGHTPIFSMLWFDYKPLFDKTQINSTFIKPARKTPGLSHGDMSGAPFGA